MENGSKVFVVAGPSGAGKGTLIRGALETLPDVHYAVSGTTRPPAAGEVDGRDYHFLSDDRFDQLLARDAFLEWEEVFGSRYGTLRSEVEGPLAESKRVLLELDVKGALTVKSKLKEATLVFVMAPSLEVLGQRLAERNRDGRDEIEHRTSMAPAEIEAGKRFDVVIMNEDVDEATKALIRVLKGEKG